MASSNRKSKQMGGHYWQICMPHSTTGAAGWCQQDGQGATGLPQGPYRARQRLLRGLAAFSGPVQTGEGGGDGGCSVEVGAEAQRESEVAAQARVVQRAMADGMSGLLAGHLPRLLTVRSPRLSLERAAGRVPR